MYCGHYSGQLFGSHLGCSIMSQPPTAEPSKCCLQSIELLFLSICVLRYYIIFKITVGKGDAPCTMGISVKYFYSQKTGQVQFFFQLNRMSEIDSSRFFL